MITGYEPYEADDLTGREQDRSAWQAEPAEAATFLERAPRSRDEGRFWNETFSVLGNLPKQQVMRLCHDRPKQTAVCEPARANNRL